MSPLSSEAQIAQLKQFDKTDAINFASLVKCGCVVYKCLDLVALPAVAPKAPPSGTIRLQSTDAADKLAFVSMLIQQAMQNPVKPKSETPEFYPERKWLEVNRPAFAKSVFATCLLLSVNTPADFCCASVDQIVQALGPSNSCLIVGRQNDLRTYKLLVFKGALPDARAILTFVGWSGDLSRGSIGLNEEKDLCASLEALGVRLVGADQKNLYFRLPAKVSAKERDQMLKFFCQLSDELSVPDFADWGLDMAIKGKQILTAPRN